MITININIPCDLAVRYTTIAEIMTVPPRQLNPHTPISYYTICVVISSVRQTDVCQCVCVENGRCETSEM